MSEHKRQCQTCLYWEIQTEESGQCIRAMSPFYDEITEKRAFCEYWVLDKSISSKWWPPRWGKARF